MAAFETAATLSRHHAHRCALGFVREVTQEAEAIGFRQAQSRANRIGREKCAALLAAQGFPSVAAAGFESPRRGGELHYPSRNPKRQLFAAQGMQIAAGVPLQCGERSDFSTFRLGLFGLDKLQTSSAPWPHLPIFWRGWKTLKANTATGRLKTFQTACIYRCFDRSSTQVRLGRRP